MSSCQTWVIAIDSLLNQFTILIPILLAGLLIRIIRNFFR